MAGTGKPPELRARTRPGTSYGAGPQAGDLPHHGRRRRYCGVERQHPVSAAELRAPSPTEAVLRAHGRARLARRTQDTRRTCRNQALIRSPRRTGTSRDTTPARRPLRQVWWRTRELDTAHPDLSTWLAWLRGGRTLMLTGAGCNTGHPHYRGPETPEGSGRANSSSCTIRPAELLGRSVIGWQGRCREPTRTPRSRLGARLVLGRDHQNVDRLIIAPEVARSSSCTAPWKR